MEKDRFSVLKRYWGYDSFRPLQEDIIQSVLDGRDTLALMPTGGGKSLCFQVPAMMMEGICLVVTPLIALMKDQVENLKARGVEAVAIYSGMKKREVDIALDNCIYGPVKFLYLSPERLMSELVRERIRHMKVNLFAIDEAHCISQWGYDFRPPYLLLSRLRELHVDVPFLALTATATPDVVQDIQDQLGFREKHVLKKSFYRDNLHYMVLPETNKQGRMLKIIRKVGGSGIVYVRNRRETQEVARILWHEGISADFYHAGLSSEDRTAKQDSWKSNQTRVIVATNAFGMGIDKPDVRFVIHLEPPESLEAYYQEAGRAGRDEKTAYAVLLYQQADLLQLTKNFEHSFPSIAFIKNVYHALGNYFQIAYGAGEGLVFDFDIGHFCQHFKWEPIPVLSALKFLEQDGWVALSESVFAPSRLKFELSPDELYRFQVENADMDGFIKMILRAYGGAFDHYVPIREQELARRLGVSYGAVMGRLQSLHKKQVLDYVPRTDSPQIEFLRSRMDKQHLHVDTKHIKLRKNIHKTKLQAVFDYLDRFECRSTQLLAYFDEKERDACGNCDVCLRKNRKNVSEEDFIQGLKELLSDGPRPLTELIDGLRLGDDDQRLDFVRRCLDRGILKESNGKYSL